MTVKELKDAIGQLEDDDELIRGFAGHYWIQRNRRFVGMLLTMSDSVEIDWYDEL